MSDLISRQAALEKVRSMQTYKLFVGDDMILVDKAEVQTELMMMPPAQPEPHEGHWIPSEETCYKMLIASQVTTEHIADAKETIREVADYIVEAAKEIKGDVE